MHTQHPPHACAHSRGSFTQRASHPRGRAAPSTHLALPSSKCCPRGGTQPLSPVPISWGRGAVRSSDPRACRTQGRVLVPVPLSRVGVRPRTPQGDSGRTSPGAGALLPALPRASLASPGSPGLWACLCLYVNLAGTSWGWARPPLPAPAMLGRLPATHAGSEQDQSGRSGWEGEMGGEPGAQPTRLCSLGSGALNSERELTGRVHDPTGLPGPGLPRGNRSARRRGLGAP